ncbi:MAG: beta-glucosidase [Candidatus Hydrogenedentota bacterium]|nr:MAG: beta-glucosidase [Candidatus Hydrogenedentota bacterium]
MSSRSVLDEVTGERFLWGTATSAFQIEGAAFEDGKGPSIWDDFTRVPGAVRNGHTADVACGHYHRWREDVALMKRIGVNAYRFSVSWPRVRPGGIGKVNQKGLDFYSRLVDALLDASIEPCVTLYHWDLPRELYRRGGWRNREIADWFAEYTAVLGRTLGDRVRIWMTINEPQMVIGLGYGEGRHAPGERAGLRDRTAMVNNLLLAHGRAVQALRASAPEPVAVGLAPHVLGKIPASDSPEDVRAAHQAMFEQPERSEISNALFSDPVLLGRFPEASVAARGPAGEELRENDLSVIAAPTDFVALNIYGGAVVRSGAEGEPEEVPHGPNVGLTSFKWPVTPESLYWGMRFFQERYRVPILISENGMSNNDWVHEDGAVHDPQRIDFLQRYLEQLERARRDGIDCRGYFHWSLLDNFEWGEGYTQRFGLVYVDFETQERIPKDSAHFYRDFIASRR